MIRNCLLDAANAKDFLRHIDFQAASGNMPPAEAKTFWWTVLGLQFCFAQSISAAADDTTPKLKVVNSLQLYYSTVLFHMMKNIAKGIRGRARIT